MLGKNPKQLKDSGNIKKNERPLETQGMTPEEEFLGLGRIVIITHKDKSYYDTGMPKKALEYLVYEMKVNLYYVESWNENLNPDYWAYRCIVNDNKATDAAMQRLVLDALQEEIQKSETAAAYKTVYILESNISENGKKWFPWQYEDIQQQEKASFLFVSGTYKYDVENTKLRYEEKNVVKLADEQMVHLQKIAELKNVIGVIDWGEMSNTIKNSKKLKDFLNPLSK